MADSIPLRTLLEDMRGSIDQALEASRADRPPAAPIEQAWPAVRGVVCDKLEGALGDDLIGLLVDGWSKARELHGYTDRTKYPEGKTVVMTLGQTKSSIVVDPQLTLVVGETVRWPLPLTVEFIATLEGVRLTIEKGEIVAVEFARLGLDAKLRWDRHELPLGLKRRDIPLFGPQKLSPPIRIPQALSL